MKKILLAVAAILMCGLAKAQNAVDLGLSVLWASENVGSKAGSGNYYEWNGLDHAALEWGKGWRTALKREWDELRENCRFKWTDDYDGMSGYLVTSMVPGFEDRSIFLPAAGWDTPGGVEQYGQYGSYWTMEAGFLPGTAFGFNFDRGTLEWHTDSRQAMQSVRAVRDLDKGQVRGIGLINEENGERVDGCAIDMEAGFSYKLLAGSLNRCISAACMWSSSDPAVASVSDDGVVFALAAGKATVSASVYGRTVKCKVRVKGQQHESVDLGLSVRWAVQNVGANDSTDAGYFFSFAETTQKTEFSSSNYKYGTENQFMKYPWNDDYGGSHTLETGDDAAAVYWGEDWHLPGFNQIMEMASNCESQWTSVNGVTGVRIVSRVPGFEGRSIFIPAAGYIDGQEPVDAGTAACVWSRNTNGTYGNDMQYSREGYVWNGSNANARFMGENVRPVTSLTDSDIEKLTISRDGMVLLENTSAHLEAGVVPERIISIDAFRWASSDESVATVSIDGIVKAVRPGKCVISASIGSQAALCQVTVKPAVFETLELWSDGSSFGSGVDLGLSVEWASCNAGAWNTGEEGGYFSPSQKEEFAASLTDGWRLPSPEEYYELFRNSSTLYVKGRGLTIKSAVKGFEHAELQLPETGSIAEKFSPMLNSSRFEGSVISMWTGKENAIFRTYGYANPTVSFNNENDSYTLRLVRDIPGRKSALENSKRPIPACQYVDLGLSVLWSATNLGADAPEQEGEVFAWGESAPKFKYDRDTYSFTKYSLEKGWKEYGVTKYSMEDQKNNFGFDNLSALEPEDDAAAVNLGQGWSIPTREQWQELADSCTWKSDSLNGMQGIRITSNVKGFEGNSIFLPFARREMEYDFQSSIRDRRNGGYWTANLDTNVKYSSYIATSIYIMGNERNSEFEGLFIGVGNESGKEPYEFNPSSRFRGIPIRPVLDRQSGQ